MTARLKNRAITVGELSEAERSSRIRWDAIDRLQIQMVDAETGQCGCRYSKEPKL